MDKLTINGLTIKKPTEWDADNVHFEINNYDYDSTMISIEDLKVINEYISEILNNYKS